MKYNIKITEYNNEIQLSIYSTFIHRTEEDIKHEISKHSFKRGEQSYTLDEQSIETNIKINQIRSRRRSKQTIYDICRANTWDYFATFTFKENRFDYEICKKKLQQFLNDFSKRKTHIEYLAIPEQHENGAWHFHMLIQGDIQKYLTQAWRSNRFQFKGFKHGINEVECVKDTQRVSMYITKYITKELQDTLKNKRRFLCSRGLKRGTESFVEVEDLNTFEYIKKTFPNYDISYVNMCSFGDGTVNYIQLKRSDVNV